VSLGHALDLAAILEDPRVTPLRAAHGGFFFVQLDALGRCLELHTLFKPEGWGRGALLAAKAAFLLMFERGADVIVTHEVAGNPRSQPPLSFRFQPAGAFRPALGASLRTWVLTRAAWEASPARRRM
jgi:hypothetical protein